MRMVHGLLSSVFWAWAEHAGSAETRRKELLARSVGRSLNRVVAVAFTAWVTITADARERRDNLYLHAARHLRNHAAAMTFDAWRAFLQWKVGLLSRTFLHMSVVGACFRSWRDLIIERALAQTGVLVQQGLDQVGTKWLLQVQGLLLLPHLTPSHLLCLPPYLPLGIPWCLCFLSTGTGRCVALSSARGIRSGQSHGP